MTASLLEHYLIGYNIGYFIGGALIGGLIPMIVFFIDRRFILGILCPVICGFLSFAHPLAPIIAGVILLIIAITLMIYKARKINEQKRKAEEKANKKRQKAAKTDNAANGKSPSGNNNAKAKTAANNTKAKTAAKNSEPVNDNATDIKTIRTAKKQCMVEYIFVNIISLFVFIAFGYVAIMSIFQTSVIDPAAYSSEKVLYQNDIVILNLLFTVIFFALAFVFRKTYDFFSKINIRFFEIGIVVWVILLGFIWIFSVTSVPAADSQNIFEAASKAAKGDYTPFIDGSKFYNKDFYQGYSYFNFYPFQLGYVWLSEIVYRVFGTTSSMPMQVINVLCLSSSYFALARIARLLFKRRSIEFFTIVLLAACFQPILLCTFVYGNIMGMSFAIWASLFLIKYFQTGKYGWLAPCGILLVLSILAKYNNMIYLVAFVIVLLIHAIKNILRWVKNKDKTDKTNESVKQNDSNIKKNTNKKKKSKNNKNTNKKNALKKSLNPALALAISSVAFALVLCIAAIGSVNLIIFSYEKRAKVELADGLSQVQYLDMGVTESYMAPGWYTRTGLDTYLGANLDNKAADKASWRSIGTKLGQMGKNNKMNAFDFFSKKILSQWNEPEFESIWVSKVKGHTNSDAASKGIGKAVYEGSLGQALELHFNLYMQILYLLFAAGIYLMFINKKTNIKNILFPLVVLGGFGYHLLFEGKSQYVLTYIPLLIPIAAYALNTILEADYSKVKNVIAIINKRLD